MKEHTITLPCYMNVGVKKPVNCLTLNWIAGQDPFAYNNAKKKYKALVEDDVEYGLPIFKGKYKTKCTYYLRRNGTDPSNVDGGVMKFLLDVLQKCMRVQEDDNRHHMSHSYDHAMDRKNPRVEFTITEVEN